MAPETHDEGQHGLSRGRLVGAALRLIQEEGLEGLSMRALAESLQVKAASLYWHVRDREELLELLAEGILENVRLPHATGAWRPAAPAPLVGSAADTSPNAKTWSCPATSSSGVTSTKPSGRRAAARPPAR